MKIFHITTVNEWSKAQRAGIYRHASLTSEGFIHLSSAEQVRATIDRYYQETTALLLLEIDADHVPAGSLVWEQSTGGEDFPHLYCELSLDAVVRVHVWDGVDLQKVGLDETSRPETGPPDPGAGTQGGDSQSAGTQSGDTQPGTTQSGDSRSDGSESVNGGQSQ